MRLERAAALAPGGVGNIGPGLDVLGMAVTGPGDRVIAERADEAGGTASGRGRAAGCAAYLVLERAGPLDGGVPLARESRLPLSGGQGGSAASAVAGAVA